LGNAYERYTSNDSAFLYFFKSVAIFKRTKNLPGQSLALYYLGNIHEIMGNFDSAAFYAYRSLRIAESINHTNLMGKNFRVIGNILMSQGRVTEALNHYLTALHHLKQKNNIPALIARTHENIALAYVKLGNFDDAELNFTEALNTYLRINEARGLARVNLNMASLRTAERRFAEALSSTRYALNFYLKINHANGIAESYNQLSSTYFSMKDYDRSIEYAKRTLEILKLNMDRDLELTALRLLHESYFEKKEFEIAYNYLKTANALNDAIFSAKKEAIINELQSRYNLQEKENEIALLNKDRELRETKIRKAVLTRNSIIGGTILLLIIIALFFNYYRASQLQKQQSERVRISSDLHDEVGSTLSSIGILSDFAMRKIDEGQIENAKGLMDEIAVTALHMGDDINDIIWAINPKNDDFESTINRLHNFTSRIAEGRNIHLDFSADEKLLKSNLAMTKRKNLLLICKEAINNAVKYSDCKNLSVHFKKDKKNLQCTVSDDGKGFKVNENYEGNGLKNMKYRAQQIHARLTINSWPDNGTVVHIALKV
jgi:signal transduction histidine kinase